MAKSNSKVSDSDKLGELVDVSKEHLEVAKKHKDVSEEHKEISKGSMTKNEQRAWYFASL
jgi:hypothetical protein